MMKSALLGTLVFVCSTAHAKLAIQGQEMKIMMNNKRTGTVSMAITSTDTSILFKINSSGVAIFPKGAKINFKASAEHKLDSQWNWKESSLVPPAFPKGTVKVTVGKDSVSLATNLGGVKNVRALPFKGRVMTRGTFYNYLRTIKPPDAFTPQQIYIFNEATISMHKSEWTYLGKERVAKESLDKYELKGGEINSVVYINSKSELAKVKELELGIELLK